MDAFYIITNDKKDMFFACEKLVKIERIIKVFFNFKKCQRYVDEKNYEREFKT